MLWNTLLLALRAIRRNLMRSFLTILGIVIGVAAVITMVTLGNGATRSVSDQISSMGSNLLMVMPGQRFGPGAEPGAPFKSADVEAVRNQISGARLVAPLVTRAATAVYQANNWSTSVTGSTNEYFEAGNWEIAAGRTFTETEERAGKAVCVIGDTLRDKLFGRQNPVGSEIRIKKFACEVIGLLKAKGQSSMGSDQDDIVVMPLRTVQRRLSGSQDINRLTISVKDGVSIDAVKAQLVDLMRERRNIGDNENDDFRVMDTRQIAETLTSTTKILTMLLARGGGGEPAGRRHRHHEHHAGVGHRAHPRDRHPPCHRRPGTGSPAAVSDRGRGPVEPRRPDRHRPGHRRLDSARRADARALPVRPRHQPAVLPVFRRHRRDLRLLPGAPGGRPQPDRRPAA